MYFSQNFVKWVLIILIVMSVVNFCLFISTSIVTNNMLDDIVKNKSLCKTTGCYFAQYNLYYLLCFSCATSFLIIPMLLQISFNHCVFMSLYQEV